MSAQRVLRLKRSDAHDDSFVLLHIVPSGSNPLDLTLSASEGQNAYITTIKQNQVSKFRAANFDGTDDQFGGLLRNTLLLEKQHGVLARDPKHLDLVAHVSPASHLSLIWRRKIGDITQRLGTIDLPFTDEEELDVYAWADIAARDFTASRLHVEGLETQLAAQTETIAKLQAQLDSLVQAKQDHEDLLLHKFSELLNSKKAKIRDQQRLLATAKVDPDAVSRIAPLTSDSHTPAPSRSSKRKVSARAPSPSDNSSSDGFEDAATKDHDEDMADAMTPEVSEEETEDDDDEKLPPVPEPKKGGLRRGIGGKSKETPEVTEKVKISDPPATRSTRSTRGSKDEEDVPPPRRELPFARKKAVEPTAAAAPPAANNDDDDTDDEL